MGKYGLSEERYQEIFTRLNDQQREAVLHDGGPALTLSSAGSGKTSVIVSRMYHLIHKKDVNPSTILAITFTKKAAEEMKTRMSEAMDDEHPEVMERLKIKTIHSFSMDLYNRTMLSMDPTFDKPDIVSAKMGMLFPAFIKLATKGEVLLYSATLDYYTSMISLLKKSMVSVEKYAEQNKLMENGKIKLNTFHRKGKIVYDPTSSVLVFYNWYEKWKIDNNCMDFDDMLWFAYDVLTDERKRAYAEPYLQRLQEILIDESQDTSTLSFKIIDELMKVTNNVTLVGDVRQTIFQFAGADTKNVHNFISAYNPKIIDLKINYRSTEKIVNNSNKLISFGKGLIGDPAVAHNKIDNKPIEILVNTNEAMEAEKIAETIRYMTQEKKIAPSSIAILYRVHSQAVALEDSLYSAKIPYYSYSKRAFYERKEVLDIFAYLKVLSDPLRVTKNDFKRIVNKPNNFISGATVDEIFAIKKENKCSVLSAMELCESVSGWGYDSLMKLHSKLSAGVRFSSSAGSVDKVVDYILNNIGYLQYMNELLEIKDAEVDLHGNFDAIKASASRFSSIEDFLEHIDELKSESDKDENGEYVKLMTIHASKGREWDHVFVAGLCDRIYPFYKCETEEDREQERRIMYVAVTRPKKELYLSVIDGKYGRLNVQPSPYIFDMTVDYTEARRQQLGGEIGYEPDPI